MGLISVQALPEPGIILAQILLLKFDMPDMCEHQKQKGNYRAHEHKCYRRIAFHFHSHN
jgi:hypothetical protein